MGRPRKNQENPDDLPDTLPETVEIGQSEPQNCEKITKNVSILDNPYLSNDQKAVLIEYGMRKIVSAPRDYEPKAAMFRWTDQKGATRCTLAKCYIDDVLKAWDFYKNNTKNPDISEFFIKISTLTTSMREVDLNVREYTLD